MLNQDTIKNEIDNYYQIINNNCSPREYADSCYAIIGIKFKNRNLERYGRSLYIDVKNFITQHLKSFDTEDYGYDIPNKDKLITAINTLPIREQLVMCRYTEKLYESYYYKTDFLEKKINRLRMQIAWEEKRYGTFFLRLSAQNMWTLLASYVIFLAVVFVVLLPAPFEWMRILHVEPYDFKLNPFMNHIMNTMAMIIGDDYAPKITPYGLRGMILIIIGNILFYLLIGNFVVKKLIDLFSFD